MNRVMFVTGATSGVGLAIARTFVSKNWKVVGISRKIENLRDVQTELGDRFSFYSVDIQNFSAVQGAFRNHQDQGETIDVLINNAAVFKMQSFVETQETTIHNIIDTNLKGTIFCTLAALSLMKTGARIINIGSVAGIHGIANQAIYCASKYAIDGFSEALNQEIIDRGISITTIASGGINTPLWNESTNPYPGDKERLLKPQDVAKLVELVVDLPSRAVLKKLTIFPSNEWH